MTTRKTFKVGDAFYFEDFAGIGFYAIRIPEGETDVDIRFYQGDLPERYKEEGEEKDISTSTIRALNYYRDNRTAIGRTPGVEEMFFSELRAAFNRKTIAPEGKFDLMKF